MTVSMQITKRIYTGNDITRQWDVDFPFASAEDIRVYVTSPAGAEEEILSDFTLNADGTELTYPTVESGKAPLAAGWTIALVRQTPLTQEIDLIRQGELDAEVLEGGYDKLTLLVQELNEKVSRSIKYPVSAQVGDLETDNFLKNILSVKQDAVNASTAAVSAAQNAQQSAFSAQEAAQTALEEIASAAGAAQNSIAQSGQTVESTLETYLSAAHEEAETARYYAEHSIGKTIGEVFFSQSSLASDNVGALPLFTGETIASADILYPEFYAWVSAHPELQIAADGYESELTQYGECPKYVIRDGSLRLPKKAQEGALYPWVAAYTAAVPASTAQVAEFQAALTGKADTSLANVDSNLDYIVESYHDADGNWYRVYKSGWVEQGGPAQSNGSSRITVSLLKPFANTTYWAFATLEQDSTSSVCGQKYKSSATTTSFETYLQQGSGWWYASGQGVE
ncbi:MAG: hypothetical protein ACI351_07700 [Candidatus Avelusimicrobium sp.]|uniref:hypothetical protein n=1 Tax=Candidatus Avelusimicrobium sp. TaxID=3048833 RepID=UPI003F09D027